MKYAIPIILALFLAGGCTSSSKKPSSIPPAPKPREVDNSRAPAEIYAELGAAYIQRGAYDLALARLHRAIEKDPDYADSYQYLGELYGRLEQWETADEYYRKALEMDPSNAQAHNNYGVFLCRRGRYDQAEEQFFLVLKDPFYQQPGKVYENMGLCAMDAKQPAKAEQYFVKALEKNPLQAAPLLYMAQMRLDARDYKGALSYVERFHIVGGYNPEVLWIGLNAARRLGDVDEEATFALLLRNKFPSSPQTALLLESDFRQETQ